MPAISAPVVPRHSGHEDHLDVVLELSDGAAEIADGGPALEITMERRT